MLVNTAPDPQLCIQYNFTPDVAHVTPDIAHVTSHI